MLIKSVLILVAIYQIAAENLVYFTPCQQNAHRDCPSSTNRSDFLLSLKKGGTNILSTSPYLYDFFLCEEYNYDCGYMPNSESYVTISNGVDLDMTQVQLNQITTQSTTRTLLKPYLNLNGQSAKCGMLIFPLMLTSNQSKEILDGYINQLVANTTIAYNADRSASATQAWTDININIRTAIIQKFKANKTMIRNSTIWSKLVINDYTGISEQLKNDYKNTDEQIDLHAAYLIDSVTQRCNKLQSVNFLVDESGSIGAPGFQLALQFLETYINNTNDDLTKASIHFFDSTFDPYIYYGNNLSYFQTKIPAKSYRSGGTYTGIAINKTVDEILAANFQNGLPKLMVVLTDGGSYDSVIEAANRARNYGITIIAVGIGASVNDTQLLQIAETSSNVIKISGYADVVKLAQFIENYFCKQILTIGLNESYIGNFVRVPESPSYFRVIKSPATEGQWYELDITYEQDPIAHNHTQFESQIDPFPDEFTQYDNAQHYQIFTQSTLKNQLTEPYYVGSSFIPKVVYFIEPEHTINYTVKKNLTNEMNVTVSYVSVGGHNLGFNISLNPCTTLTCVEQKAKYSKYKSNNKNSTTIIIITPIQDLSIFIAIGTTLAVLACLCILLIFAVRKYSEEQKKKKKKMLTDFQNTITQQHIEDTLMPVESTKKIQRQNEQIQ